MSSIDPWAEAKLIRLKLCLYLVPVLGILPALWQVNQTATTPQQRQQVRLSRRSLQLSLVWLGSYFLLWGGSALAPEMSGLRLMYLNGLLTSGYFVVNLLWMGKIFFRPTRIDREYPDSK